MPDSPITALASAISCSLAISTTPFVVLISCSALGQELGRRFGSRSPAFPASRPARNSFRLGAYIRKTGRIFRLNYCQPRHPINESGGMQLAQSLAECGNITEIAARQHDPIGRYPVSLIHQLDDDRLLTFNSKWVNRIQQINAEVFGENSYEL